MIKIMWAVILLFIIGSGILIFVVNPDNADATENSQITYVARTAYLIGDVRMATPNQQAGARMYSNQLIPDRSVILTSENSRAVVAMENGSYLAINSNTIVQIRSASISANSQNNQMTFNVVRGSTRIHASYSAATEGFQVSTISTQCAVRGTEFLVGVSDTGASNIIVLEGSVQVTGSNDAATTQTVNQSNAATVNVNEQPAAYQLSENVVNYEVTGHENDQYNFSMSRDMVSWAQNQQQILNDNPAQVLSNMSIRLDNIKEETNDLIDDIQSATGEIQTADDFDMDMTEAELSPDQLARVRELDARINISASQNYAVDQVSQRILDNNQGNNDVASQFEIISEKVSEINALEQEMDTFIDEMEQSINELVSRQEDAIRRMIEQGGFNDNDPFRDDDDDNNDFDGGFGQDDDLFDDFGDE